MEIILLYCFNPIWLKSFSYSIICFILLYASHIFDFSSSSKSPLIISCPVKIDNPVFEFIWYKFVSCPNKVAKTLTRYDLPEAVGPWIIGVFFVIMQQIRKIKQCFCDFVKVSNNFLHFFILILSGLFTSTLIDSFDSLSNLINKCFLSSS